MPETPLPTKKLESPIGAEVLIDGRRYVNFAGSSYLGLAGMEEFLDAGADTLRSTGSGYQLAWVYNVATVAHQNAEAEAAQFFGTESAMYLASGYFFGLISFAALTERYQVIFFDEHSHRSLRDGIAASGIRNYSFRHLSAEDLGRKITQTLRPGERPLVATDGMYSTRGEIAPLNELAVVTARYGGRLVVDESHAFGVLGTTGRGACEYHDIPSEAALVGGSTGKAFGVVGGVFPGTHRDIASLRSVSAGRGASVGLPAAAMMCAHSFKYVRTHPMLLQQLRKNVVYAKTSLRKLGIEVDQTVAPVAAFAAGSANDMKRLQERLMSEGVFVLYTNYIGAGDSGLIRCGIFADHTTSHIDHLVATLRRIL